MDAIDSLLNPLKPILHPIVTNLPAPLHSFALSLLGEKCTASILHNLDFSSSNQECVKLGISKALGIGIIAASSIVKIPQLLKLISSQSATGLSFSSYLLETLSFLITLAYSVRAGFPFSTFGETALIAVQDVIIGALILVYSGRGAAAGAFVAGVAALIYALLGPGDLVGADMLRNLQAGAGVLGIASKVPQIFTVWKEGTTGQLSAFAVFNYLAGSLSRIFTTLQEISDPIILYGYIAGFALNAVLAIQMLYYWNAPASKKIDKKTHSKGVEHIKKNVGMSEDKKEGIEHIKKNVGISEDKQEGIEHIKKNVGISGGQSSSQGTGYSAGQGHGEVKQGPWLGAESIGKVSKTTTTRRRG